MKIYESRKEKSRKEFENYMKELKDFEMIGEYKGQNTKTEFIHKPCNYRWKTTPYNFKKSKHKCHECAKNAIAEKLKLDQVEVFKDIESKGYTVLPNEIYKNEDTHINIKHNKCGTEYPVTYNNFKNGKRCPKCANDIRGDKKRNTKEEYMETISHFSDLNDYILGDYIGIDEKMEVTHKICNNTYLVTPNMFRRGRRCPYCKDNSIAETRIAKKLEDMCIKYQREYTFDNLVSSVNSNYKLRYDFAILNENDSLKYLIEYDGKQHFEKDSYYTDESFERLKLHDKMKNEYCEVNNIKLFRIHHDCFKNLESYIEKIVSSSTTIETVNKGVEYIQANGNMAN